MVPIVMLGLALCIISIYPQTLELSVNPPSLSGSAILIRIHRIHVGYREARDVDAAKTDQTQANLKKANSQTSLLNMPANNTNFINRGHPDDDFGVL